MKVIITGAAKGIGKRLTDVINQKHEVTAIVRTLKSLNNKNNSIEHIPYAQTSLVDKHLRNSDCVIHCALDTKTGRKGFLQTNLDLNKHILEQSLKGNCKLLVYLSSQVVYSSIEPADENGYREDQKCELSGKADDYTRLKLLSEQMIVTSCQHAKLDFLILRPTIVIGEELIWIKGMRKLLRWFPVGIKNRTMNLIHISDLSRLVEKLIELEIRNQIFNIGGRDYKSEYYYKEMGKRCSRRIIFLPEFIGKCITPIIPSTLWFFRKTVSINCNKVKLVTGLQATRSMDDIFLFNSFREHCFGSLNRLQAIQRSSIQFRSYGSGYSLKLNPRMGTEKKILLEDFAGVVSLEDNFVTVKTGTKLSDLVKFLERHDLSLPTLPEFTGNTAGACFFVDIHGSSCDYFSLYDLITEIKYLDNSGNVIVSKRNDTEWEELRKRKKRFVLTELTFKCSKFNYLLNQVEWKRDAVLLDYISYTHKKNLSTTIQWYPYYKKCLIYNINKADSLPSKFVNSKAFYRGLPYIIQTIIVVILTKGNRVQYDKCYNILGPWQDLPFRNLIKKRCLTAKSKKLCDLEFYVPLEDGVRFISVLREMVDKGEICFPANRSIGFRFSYKKTVGEERLGFIWIELLCADQSFLNQFLAIATRVCKGDVHFHQGKYIPCNIIDGQAKA